MICDRFEGIRALRQSGPATAYGRRLRRAQESAPDFMQTAEYGSGGDSVEGPGPKEVEGIAHFASACQGGA